MFGSKKPPSKRAGQSLAQYGLFDIPDNLDNIGGAGSDGDSDLEAELAAIAGGGGKKRAPAKPKPKAIPQADLDQLVAASLRDIPSDEEISDGDDDPDLLSELHEIAGDEEEETVKEDEAPAPPPRASRPAPPPPAAGDMTGLLQERLDLYILAEKNAKEAGDTSKARRFNRGLKTLKDLLKQAKAGKPINEEDIPPVVSTGVKPPSAAPVNVGDDSPTSPGLPAPMEPTVVEQPKPDPEPTSDVAKQDTPVAELSEETKENLRLLNERKNEYKRAALMSKKEGDTATALAHLRLVKQFDVVMQAVISGHTVDLSDMPGPPGDGPPPEPSPPMPQKEEEHVQQSTDVPSDPVPEESSQGLVTASSVEEALQQRLQLYKNQEAAAKDAGNSSKARRMGRIVKQFEQAVKLHKAGKPIPYDELPNPPGYAPIPGAPKQVDEEPPPASQSQPQPTPSMPAEPTSPPSASGKPSSSGSSGGSMRKMGNQTMSGRAGQQLALLLQRQKEFKEAALNAKKNGEQKEAIAYLRSAKGMDPLIEAARGGLPVDLSSVPLPPQAKQQLEDSFDIVMPADCDPTEEGEGLMSRLEQQLTEQLRLCLDTGEHHKAMGDVAGTNRFHHLALAVKQDLDVVKLAKRSGSENIKFHYESKEFSVVQCCTDLGDNDLELTIVRGISYTVANPKEIDTYVKFEFPYPETPTCDKTPLVKDTNSPEYNSVFTIPINRQARPCVRIFKRQAVKLEVYSRGGFFTRDSLIGTVLVKLQPLETQTVLHDSFDLMSGRKAVGGKLEVKIRVRHPILTKQVEHNSRKWLVIDH